MTAPRDGLRLAFQAELIGALVPQPPWTGRLAARYDHALNLTLGEGLLVGIVSAREQMSPSALLVPELFASPTRSLLGRLTRTTAASRSGDLLTIGSLPVSTAGAARWEGRLRAGLTGALSDPTRIVVPLVRAISREGREESLCGIVSGGESGGAFVRSARERLDRALNRAPGGQAADLSELIGLGIGLTPSGDDFVTGALLASELTGGGIDRRPIADALGKTTDGGRMLLTAAVDRRFPAYLVSLAEALVDADRTVDREASAALIGGAVRTAADHGATSGSDALTGVAWELARTARVFV